MYHAKVIIRYLYLYLNVVYCTRIRRVMIIAYICTNPHRLYTWNNKINAISNKNAHPPSSWSSASSSSPSSSSSTILHNNRVFLLLKSNPSFLRHSFFFFFIIILFFLCVCGVCVPVLVWLAWRWHCHGFTAFIICVSMMVRRIRIRLCYKYTFICCGMDGGVCEFVYGKWHWRSSFSQSVVHATHHQVIIKIARIYIFPIESFCVHGVCVWLIWLLN